MKYIFSKSFITHFIVVICHFAFKSYLVEHPLRNHKEVSRFIVYCTDRNMSGNIFIKRTGRIKYCFDFKNC
jgi:hypothetical protein